MISYTLRFIDPKMTERFIELCKKEGHHGSITKAGEWDLVKVQFSVKTEKARLIRKWAEISIERK